MQLSGLAEVPFLIPLFAVVWLVGAAFLKAWDFVEVRRAQQPKVHIPQALRSARDRA